MKLQPASKALLVQAIQKWLDTELVQDDIGGNLGIWQDSSSAHQNANYLADLVEAGIALAALQSDLEFKQNS